MLSNGIKFEKCDFFGLTRFLLCTAEYITSLFISLIQRDIYKKLHASARLLTICNSLGWSLSAGYTTEFLHLGTRRSGTQAEISMVLMAWYNHMYLVIRQRCVNVVVTHVLRVILGLK